MSVTIHAIPVEILEIIFHHAILRNTNPNASPSPSPTFCWLERWNFECPRWKSRSEALCPKPSHLDSSLLFPIAGVCSLWRETTLRMPSLWASYCTADAKIVRSPEHETYLAELCMERSKEALLNVCLPVIVAKTRRERYKTEDKLTTVLLSQLHRIQELRVLLDIGWVGHSDAFDDARLDTFADCFTHNNWHHVATNLRELVIVKKGDRCVSIVPALLDAPKLPHVTLQGIYMLSGLEGASNLTTLHLVEIEDIGNLVDNVISTLSRSPMLTHFTLKCSRDSDSQFVPFHRPPASESESESESGFIHLPHLKQLVIESPPDVCKAILYTIKKAEVLEELDTFVHTGRTGHASTFADVAPWRLVPEGEAVSLDVIPGRGFEVVVRRFGFDYGSDFGSGSGSEEDREGDEDRSTRPSPSRTFLYRYRCAFPATARFGTDRIHTSRSRTPTRNGRRRRRQDLLLQLEARTGTGATAPNPNTALPWHAMILSVLHRCTRVALHELTFRLVIPIYRSSGQDKTAKAIVELTNLACADLRRLRFVVGDEGLDGAGGAGGTSGTESAAHRIARARKACIWALERVFGTLCARLLYQKNSETQDSDSDSDESAHVQCQPQHWPKPQTMITIHLEELELRWTTTTTTRPSPGRPTTAYVVRVVEQPVELLTSCSESFVVKRLAFVGVPEEVFLCY